MRHLTRRRVIAISAAACVSGTAAAAAGISARWNGVALGAPARMQITGLPAGEAAPVFAAVEAEIARLEQIFSLYRPGSVLSRLNRDGAFAAPPAELLELCSLATALHRGSGGAFDPTIQPLWALTAAHAARGRAPDPQARLRAMDLADWNAVHFDAASIRFARPGIAITLNGIAQGFITDRIAAKLQAMGLRDVLIDIGEIRAWGRAPDGGHWRAGIAGPAGGCCVHRVTLADRALATSAPLGTVMDTAGAIGHILDPRTGETAMRVRQVSVSAPTAVVADGVSTALCATGRGRWPDVTGAFPGVRIENTVVQAGSAPEPQF